MKRAAVYCRISQDRAGTMLGVDRQREDCERLCAQRGWTVAEVLVDDDVSAYTRRKVRHAYRTLLDRVKDGQVDAIVAWHPDRLHRSPAELEEFIDLVDAAGVAVATVQAGEYDLSSASGRMVARIVGAVARHESEQKAERIRRQREQAARAGRPHGGRRCFGYAANGLDVVDTEAALIRDAAARLLAGERPATIADEWNAKGITTPLGRPWRITTLVQTLTSPRVAGLRVHRGEIIGDGAWPPILDRDTHERLRVVAGNPRRRPRGRPPVYLLSSFLRCGRCGSTLHASKRTTDGALRFICTRAPGVDACGRISVVARPLEELVVGAVLYRLASPAVRKATRRRPTQRPGPDHAAVIARCEHRLDELAEMYGAGELDRRGLVAARRRVQDELDEARRALARAEGTEALAPLRDVDPAAAWEHLDLDRRRAVLAALIDHVVIASANGRSTFAADRVHIEWRA